MSILAFYVAATATMAILVILLVIGTVVVAGAARVGLAGTVAGFVRPVVDLLRLFATRLWLRDAATLRIPLTEQDAPRLVRAVRDLAARLEVPPPEKLVLELHTNAWVRLDGFRRATGTVTLGVGFDLLAGLTVREVEAVLAHELGHMRFVQRGLARWLNRGLSRLAHVADALDAYAAGRRAAGRRSDLAEWSCRGFQALARRTARLVATCSRQDEFDADQAAATICGADAMRSALLKLGPLATASDLVPWPERVARLQSGQAYATWLAGELTSRTTPQDADALPRHAVDHYSTHPSLRDRLLALPASTGGAAEAGTGLALLANPDQLAARLADEATRVQEAEERKDSARVARDTRRWSRRRELGVLQGLAVLLWLCAALVAFGILTTEFEWSGVITTAVLLVGGAAAWWAGAFRPARPLPIPEFGTFGTFKPFDNTEALQQAERQIEADLGARVSAADSARGDLAILLNSACEALAHRDYLRAHVASRLALGRSARSIEARLGYAIAAAGLGDRDQALGALDVVRRKVGVRTPHLLWGAAWTLVMLQDPGAEGLLLALVKRQPAEPTFAALLARAQLIRGKTVTGIATARKAQALAPASHPIARLVLHGLLQSGRVREAVETANRMATMAEQDVDAAFLLVRTWLMAHDADRAARWAERVRALDQDGRWLVMLGGAFTDARRFEAAKEHFTLALGTAYAPQAHLSLARLANVAGARATARTHCLAALRMQQARFTEGITAGQVFTTALALLNTLTERRITGTAWLCEIPVALRRFPLEGCTLLVFAETEAAAREHFVEIATAMEDPDAPLPHGTVTWRRAPDPQQPIRPVFPGVQMVVG